MKPSNAGRYIRDLFHVEGQDDGSTAEGLNKELERRIAEANLDSFSQLVDLNNQRMLWAERMHGQLEQSLNSTKTMCYVAYIFGWVLILVPSLMFFFSTSRDTNLLWFSGIGLAETLSIMVYQPIQRVQKATCDMVQSNIILSSWATDIGLLLHALRVEEIKTIGQIKEATGMISEISDKHVKMLQEFAENGSSVVVEKPEARRSSKGRG